MNGFTIKPMNMFINLLFFIVFLFYPVLVTSTPIDVYEDELVKKELPLIPKIPSQMDRINANSSTACTGGDIDVLYCESGRKLYKLRVNISSTNHRLRINLRDQKITYIPK